MFLQGRRIEYFKVQVFNKKYTRGFYIIDFCIKYICKYSIKCDTLIDCNIVFNYYILKVLKSVKVLYVELDKILRTMHVTFRELN